MRHKSYPYYVVHKASGKVVAGAEFREDAHDVSRDMPIPESALAVLTHGGVVRKYGRVSWGYPPSMMPSKRMTRSNPSSAVNGYDGNLIATGDRVELSPATDLWMRGARYGTALGVNRRADTVRVKLDRMTKPVTFPAQYVRAILD